MVLRALLSSNHSRIEEKTVAQRMVRTMTTRSWLAASASMGIVLASPALAKGQSTIATSAYSSAEMTAVDKTPQADAEQAQVPTTAADPVATAAEDTQAGADIVVTGERATQRTSINLKRNADVIVDGLVSDEIGASPDNSVGDTLERIAGVTADRFKGNANEISVRGLGPTLSFATFNGREVSSAGPDRSVAFQQFPSELVNGVLVYKSQEADFLEGGVGGIIDLRSIKPLDYGKRRISFEVRGDFQPKDDDVIGHDGLGYRANFSYTDQYHSGLGDIGVSFGYQRQDTTAPEDYYNGNSAFVPCNTAADDPTLIIGSSAALKAAGASVNCALEDAPRSGTGETVGDTYYTTSSRSFRAQKTHELRDAAIGTVQWKPSDTLEVAFDGEYSKRRSTENRNTFAITEGLRGVQPLLIGTGDNGYSKGALISYRGNSNLEDQLELRERDETYLGGGSTITWHNDRLTLVADGSYSGSHRTETQRATRMRSSRRVGYTLTYNDHDVVPEVDFDNFDITDPSLFLTTAPNSVYARNRFVTDRWDKIWAGRIDGSYDLDGFFTALKFGGRYSDHHRTNDNAANNDLNTLVAVNGVAPADLIAQANQNCRAPFTTSSYMDGTGSNIHQWATFNNECLYRTFTGGDDTLPYPTDSRDPSDIDVRERITALYAMAQFRSDGGAIPFSGNIGLRYIDTKVDSIGFRLPYVITVDTVSDDYVVDVDDSGVPIKVGGKGHYHYWLPSANIAFDLSSKVKLRLAGYRAIARSGIEDLGAGINLNPSTGTGTTDFVFNATTGNPNLKPLRAWNADASLEFYPTRDTLLSIAGYYKWAKGTVIDATVERPTQVDVTTITDGGTPVTNTVTINPVAPTNDSETRHLYGVEVNANTAFTFLPSPLDGFGVQLAANRAFADFEYPDTSKLAGYLDPANLIGLSKWTASGSLYWEKWGLSLRALYRYRSNYFKPNSNTNRSVQGSGYLNLSAQYDLNKYVQIKLQALNVTGTKDVFYKGGYDSIAEVSNSGTQYYFGFRVKL